MTDYRIQTLGHENTEQRDNRFGGAHREKRRIGRDAATPAEAHRDKRAQELRDAALTEGTEARDKRLAWERRCYGCTAVELRDCIEEHRAMTGPSMMAASCASDAQDSMAFARAATSVAERDAHLEQGLQALNRLKFVLAEELREPRGC